MCISNLQESHKLCLIVLLYFPRSEPATFPLASSSDSGGSSSGSDDERVSGDDVMRTPERDVTPVPSDTDEDISRDIEAMTEESPPDSDKRRAKVCITRA